MRILKFIFHHWTYPYPISAAGSGKVSCGTNWAWRACLHCSLQGVYWHRPRAGLWSQFTEAGVFEAGGYEGVLSDWNFKASHYGWLFLCFQQTLLPQTRI